MVSIEAVRASNARLKNTQPGLVALFVGATSGIGEYTLKQFYRQTASPVVYFVGRNQSAATRILSELEPLNPTGTATFLRADITLLSSVRTLCASLLTRSQTLNLLFLTPGTLSLKAYSPTPESLDRKLAANYYARLYFVRLLLPLLRATATAGGLARVVSVLAAGREGEMDFADLELRRGFSLGKAMRHAVGMTGFAFEELAGEAENAGVGFVHAFPGWVRTGFARDEGVLVRAAVRVVGAVMAWKFIGAEESGERHLWVATSGAFPGRVCGEGEGEGKVGKGEEEVQVARGSDGVVGSGAYLVGEAGQVVGNEKVLKGLRARGAGPKIWAHTLEVFERVERGWETDAKAAEEGANATSG
ncbi:MAG: hypothetical protein FRX48_06463 [Lasallia pustulata]|uniref:Short-chain dehydrogenase/reductase SDR n=1 Tax=Lasallia pustulata TaxID=136370 RepID=A0A5M8PKJ4_9LECA|nr:MAG: hypothetical protein FRX48_06463 [Lasallia pustulata]